jgi:hypothetical protein
LKHLKAKTGDDAETKFQKHDLLYNFYLDKSFIFWIKSKVTKLAKRDHEKGIS